MEENHMGWKLVQGVRQDVVKLFKLFADRDSVRYEDFCESWKEMKFYTIFSHRNSYIERIEFVEELFHIVKEYLLPAYEFHCRIAALYTLYGLYFKQPFSDNSKIRIRFTKSEWDEMQTLMEKCKAEKHYDAVFIYLRLFLSDAFLFTVTQRTVGLEDGIRKYFQKRYYPLPKHYDVELFRRPLLNQKLISSLSKLEELYCKKKHELLGKKNLDFINTKFSDFLQNELKEQISNNSNARSISEDNNKTCIEKKGSSDGTASSSQNSVRRSLESSSNKKAKSGAEGKGTVKRKLSNICLLAKKRAKLYIKQLQGNGESQKSDGKKEEEIRLPDLDEISKE